MDIASSCHQGTPNSQGFGLSCQSSPCCPQPFREITKARANTAKRRRLSKGQSVRVPAICQTPNQQQNESTTQFEDQYLLTHTSTHLGQQSLSLRSEEGGNAERGRVSLAPNVATHGGLVPISEEIEEMQDRSMAHSGLRTDDTALVQRLSSPPSNSRRSTLDNSSVQQFSLVDDVPSPKSNVDPHFRSYATEIADILDDDARNLFGLGDNFQ